MIFFFCLTERAGSEAEVLEPLKERYASQHYALRKFYYECSNLKYLTGLINVPKLGPVRSPLLPSALLLNAYVGAAKSS